MADDELGQKISRLISAGKPSESGGVKRGGGKKRKKGESRGGLKSGWPEIGWQSRMGDLFGLRLEQTAEWASHLSGKGRISGGGRERERD